jgi:hypothetical protein
MLDTSNHNRKVITIMDFRGYINENHFISLSYYSKLNMFQQVSHLLVMLCCLRKTEVREKIRAGRGASSSGPYHAYAKCLPRETPRGAHANPMGKRLHGIVSDSTLQAARRGGRLPTYISHFLSTLSITTNEELNGHRLKYQFWLTFVVQIFYMLRVMVGKEDLSTFLTDSQESAR